MYISTVEIYYEVAISAAANKYKKFHIATAFK